MLTLRGGSVSGLLRGVTAAVLGSVHVGSRDLVAGTRGSTILHGRVVVPSSAATIATTASAATTESASGTIVRRLVDPNRSAVKSVLRLDSGWKEEGNDSQLAGRKKRGCSYSMLFMAAIAF